jgi:hypothetical protein
MQPPMIQTRVPQDAFKKLQRITRDERKTIALWLRELVLRTLAEGEKGEEPTLLSLLESIQSQQEAVLEALKSHTESMIAMTKLLIHTLDRQNGKKNGIYP